MIDPVSQNPVPPGAMPKEVRDDIDIKASEKTRACSKCGIEKPLSQFSPRKDRPLGRHYSCKLCNMLTARAWRNKTLRPESFKKEARKRSAEYRRLYPEKVAETKKLWSKKYPERKAELSARYRTNKIKRTPAWLSKEQKEEIKNFYWLARDLRAVTGEEYHVDHIVPLRGQDICGLHVPWNLQVIPKDLNLSKHNKVVSL